MKKMRFNLFIMMMSMFTLLFVASCKKDDPEPEPEDNKPVLDEDFSFTVNENDVVFTTTLTGNVWFRDITNAKDYTAVNGTVTAYIGLAGTYPFTCNTLIEGATVSSDTFNVVIAQDNLEFLNQGLWLYLTGGEGKTKTWRLDINTDGKCVYFDGPMYFSGYSDGDNRKTEWSYWAWDVMSEDLPVTVNGVEQTSFFNWSPDYPGNSWIMSAQNYGTITFDGNTMSVSTDKFGATENGSFSFDTATMKITINGVIIPIDTARMNEGQYLEENLQNMRIFSLSDSAMQIGIKRSFEGKEADGVTKKVSEWVNVYNFVVDDYSYPQPEEYTFEPAPKTSFTASNLVGTWKLANVPMGWIGYTKVGDQGTNIPARLFEKWNARADVVATLVSWGLGSIDSVFTANDANTYVFNADGSCTLKGVANTYTVSNGIITFGTALSGTEFSMTTSWLNHSLTGTAVTVIDVNNYGSETEYEAYTPQGIWIGQKNGDKTEYSGFQLVKQ